MIIFTGHAHNTSFNALMAAAFLSPGSVTLNKIAWMDLMKSTVVSLINPFNLYLKSVNFIWEMTTAEAVWEFSIRIFSCKREEVTERWRKFHNEKLYNLYSSPKGDKNIKCWKTTSKEISWKPRHKCKIILKRMWGERAWGVGLD